MVRYLFNTRVTGHDWEVTNGMRGQGEEGESIRTHRKKDAREEFPERLRRRTYKSAERRKPKGGRYRRRCLAESERSKRQANIERENCKARSADVFSRGLFDSKRMETKLSCKRAWTPPPPTTERRPDIRDPPSLPYETSYGRHARRTYRRSR
jgi:hypothetical protein